MGKKIKRKITAEVRKFVSEAEVLALGNNCKVVSLEAYLLTLFQSYIKGSGESEEVKKIISDCLTDEDVKKDFLKDLKAAHQRTVKKIQVLGEDDLAYYRETKHLLFSDDLQFTFEKCLMYYTIGYSDFDHIEDKSISGDSDSIVTTLDTILFSLSSSSNPGVKVLAKYGFTADNIRKLKPSSCSSCSDGDFSGIKKLLEDVLGAHIDELKVKRIEEDPTASKKSDEEKDMDFEKAGETGAINTKKDNGISETPTLDQYGVNMAVKAKNGEYDVVVGREKELSQIIEILCCRKKNNAALLGDPGCGKTAVVEGLAQLIASGKVPNELKNKKIYSISINDLQAGTMYRGQLEQRIQSLCSEVAKAKNVIIYMDEFHQATSEGSSNISQMLKPALGRGEFQAIISTTNDEYRKFIEKDGALKRRFEPVAIDEPTVEETKEILKGLSKSYGEFHKVKYTDDVIDCCVEWSGKYINDRYFPDKAIGVLDLASSLTKLKSASESLTKEEEDKIYEEIFKKYDELEAAIESGDFEKAVTIRNERLDLEKNWNDMVEASSNPDPSTWPVVTIDEVSKVISKTSGVPIDKIMNSDINKVRRMKEELEKRVIGQDEAIKELTIALQRNILGLRDENKPIASFLLVGPTGVGKSLVSKVLATEFFGNEKNLTTIACSEYMQDWAESKLLGSAPGYVGFSDSEPRLYVLKRKPYSVLLVDEIEKSSNNLYNIWLQMLEEGSVTLSSGEVISLKNCIIIFTGNVGTKSLELKGNGIGFEKLTGDAKRAADIDTVMKEVKKEFRPEFINRLNKVIVFNSLTNEDMKSIFDIEFNQFKERLRKRNLEVSVSEGMKNYIVSKCEPQYGARSLKRLIIENVENKICEKMLDVDITGKTEINIDIDSKEDIQVCFS